MTGAVPNTRWLGRCVTLDTKEFIKTGPDLSPQDLAAARWPLARPPYLLETTLPGVFAVGDVRAGNIKRVASAVGEGSIASAFVHQVLTSNHPGTVAAHSRERASQGAGPGIGLPRGVARY